MNSENLSFLCTNLCKNAKQGKWFLFEILLGFLRSRIFKKKNGFQIHPSKLKHFLQCLAGKSQIEERHSGVIFSACKTSARAKEQLQDSIEIHATKGWWSPKGVGIIACFWRFRTLREDNKWHNATAVLVALRNITGDNVMLGIFSAQCCSCCQHKVHSEGNAGVRESFS